MAHHRMGRITGSYRLRSILTLYRQVLVLSTYFLCGECSDDAIILAVIDYSG